MKTQRTTGLIRPPSNAFICAALASLIPVMAQASSPGDPYRFERLDVALGEGRQEIVVTGFLLGRSRADIAVISNEEAGQARVDIRSWNGDGWAPALQAPLRPDLVLVDVASMGREQRLLTYAGGELHWFDPATRQERFLARIDIDFEWPHWDGTAHLDISHDLNGDGRDDLLVPVASGYSVFMQQPDGSFARPFTIGTRPQSGHVGGADGYRHDPWATARVHAVDCDLDGRDDLVFWDGEQFLVRLQDASGRFAGGEVRFPANVAFDGDDLALLAAPVEARQRHRDTGLEGAMRGRVLHGLSDIDGDGLADLTVFMLEGHPDAGRGQAAQMWRMAAHYEVHFGRVGADGMLEFNAAAGARLSYDGIPFGLITTDLDGDGRGDVLVTGWDPGVLRAAGVLLRALFTRSTAMELAVFRLAEQGYPEQPDGQHKIRVGVPDEAAGGKSALFPPVLVAEVTGDARPDLLVGHGDDELHVYAGVDGPGIFARRAQEVAIELPRNEAFTWLADMDNDGRQDLFMHHTGNGRAARLSVLLTRPTGAEID